MPELPEVEVTRLSLLEASGGRSIRRCCVRERRLRFPVTRGLQACMQGNRFIDWRRRGKYLIAALERGFLLIHLGMSGRLTHSRRYRYVRHDHITWSLDNGLTLIFNDPRRFGCVLYADDANFALLDRMGREPLHRNMNGAWLLARCSNSQRHIKNCLMDQHIVAGLGNIYVNEALFLSGIHPLRRGNEIAPGEYGDLARAIKRVLRRALRAGGTSLKDFSYGENWPGYFAQSLRVYERGGRPCPHCGRAIGRTLIAQRSSYFCPDCQPLRRPGRTTQKEPRL